MSYPPPQDPTEGGTPPPTGPTAYPPPGGMPPAAPSPYGYQQPGGYAQPGYQVPREHPQGTTVLVLGIISLVVCGLVAPFAWVMGSRAIKEIDANPAAYTNRSTVQIGRVLGIIGTVLIAIGIVFAVIIVIAAVASEPSSTY